MRVRLTTRTERIETGESGLELSFNKGASLNTDLVVIATGIQPRDELASEAGLATAVGGILVNASLQTDVSNVYAIGECASYNGKAYGLLAPCYEMADTLARGLAGKRARYLGSDESSRLKLLGLEVSVFGDFLEEGQYYVHRGEKTYRSLVVSHGKLIGATVIGPWVHAGEVERAVRRQRKVRTRTLERFERTGDIFEAAQISSVLEWSDVAIVCNCTRTNSGVLKQSVVGGCSTVAALAESTGAGKVCGTCMPYLAEYVGASSASYLDMASPKGGRFLLASAVMALLLVGCIVLWPPLPVAQSVQTAYYSFSQIWQNSLLKQITGYTIAGLSVLALLLSARKRLGWLDWGNYGLWRAAHSCLGLATIAGLFFHTGLNFGEHLNRWLLLCFLGLNLAGGLAALAVVTEKRFSARMGLRLRRLSARAHLLFFIPYPVLLGFHIAKVYIY